MDMMQKFVAKMEENFVDTFQRIEQQVDMIKHKNEEWLINLSCNLT